MRSAEVDRLAQIICLNNIYSVTRFTHTRHGSRCTIAGVVKPELPGRTASIGIPNRAAPSDRRGPVATQTGVCVYFWECVGIPPAHDAPQTSLHMHAAT